MVRRAWPGPSVQVVFVRRGSVYQCSDWRKGLEFSLRIVWIARFCHLGDVVEVETLRILRTLFCVK